jgi:hypothetical protein
MPHALFGRLIRQFTYPLIGNKITKDTAMYEGGKKDGELF